MVRFKGGMTQSCARYIVTVELFDDGHVVQISLARLSGTPNA